MKTRLSLVIINLCTLISFCLFLKVDVLPQCGGIYFNADYRAIDKIRYQHGSPFLFHDWTGDGRSDFWNFRANASTPTHDVLIYPAKPTGFWDWDNPIVLSTTIPNTESLQGAVSAVRDFNSDGRIEFIFGGRIHQNAGNGTLVPLAQFTHSDPTSALMLGTLAWTDLNSDGLLDWLYYVAVSPTGQEIRYQLANADGSFQYRTIIIAHTAQNGLNNASKAFGDFDGDGDGDIVYYNRFGNDYNYAFIKYLGGGSFEVGSLIQAQRLSWFEHVRDLNGDGRADIIAESHSPHEIVILFGQANGTLTESRYPALGLDSTTIKTSDLNGDGFLDIIENDSTHYSVFINNASGAFSRADYFHYAPVDFVEDMNADGKADLFAASHSTYNVWGEEILVVEVNSCTPVRNIVGHDFDSLEVPDVAMWNPGSGRWSSRNGLWGGDPNSAIKTFSWGLGSLGDVPAPGDFDGDWKSDYAVYRNSTGEWYILRSSDNSWTVARFGLSGDIAIPNDYNGGGKTDIAVFRPTDGNWHFLLSETQQYYAVHFGSNGDRPVPADYDGDGKTDIGVYRPADGTWYHYRSSDSNVGIIRWGVSSDIPIPADFDGDKKADITVYRSGVWYILRTMDYSYRVFYWGTNSDIPTTFYRNDITSDLVVYRPSNNLWYNWAYAGPPTTVLPLGGQGDVPVHSGLPNN